MLKGHGDDTHDYEHGIISNFSSNIYGRHDLSGLQDYLCCVIEKVQSYPEPDANSLAVLIAEKHSIETENIIVTNGATEAIYLIAQAFQNSRTGIVIPTFSEYEDACGLHGHKLKFYRKPKEIPSDLQIVWICNPNNPDGQVYDITELENIVKEHPETLFVFDQSYKYFTSCEVWNIKKACGYKNVILLHSMTKQYAIPGLRLGYITAHPSIIETIGKYRMPWSVNAMAIEAGKFLLENETESIAITDYLKETKRLQNALNEINDIEILPTKTHFFLCKLKNRKASDLKAWLIRHYGILIRDAANFRGLDEHYFRIATQSPEENNLLVKAIKEWM